MDYPSNTEKTITKDQVQITLVIGVGMATGQALMVVAINVIGMMGEGGVVMKDLNQGDLIKTDTTGSTDSGICTSSEKNHLIFLC